MRKYNIAGKTIFRLEFFNDMPSNDTINTYVYEKSHLKVKGFAGFRGMALPDAYDLIVNAGLKALGYDVAAMK